MPPDPAPQSPSPEPNPTPPAPSSSTPPADAPAIGGEIPAAPAAPDAPKPGEPPKPAEPPAAPEPVTFEALTLPEGFEADNDLSKEFLSIINDRALSPKELADKLLDLQTRSMAVASERGSESFATTVGGWKKSLETDPEIGGPKLASTLAEANRVVNQYGTPELKQMLITTGVGNHPEFARLLAKIAPMVTEPKAINGGPKANGVNYSPDNLYPTQPSGA